jgi:hypothetical protein
MAGARDAEKDAALAQTLAGLKRRGCNLLVVGSDKRRAHARACERLRGDADAGPRRRVVVRTAAGPDHVARGDPDVEVDAGGPTTRSAATAGSAAAADPLDSPSALAGATVDAVDGLEPADRAFEPAELRLCVESLLPLAATHGADRLRALLGPVTERVQAADGIGHYHLPLAADDPLVEELTPRFDAVIHLRTRDGDPEHRWDLVERDVDSGWLPL